MTISTITLMSWTGEKNVKMSKSQFNKIWGNQAKRAISY